MGILTGWVLGLCLWWWGTHFTRTTVVLGWFPGAILENILALSFASPWETPCLRRCPLPYVTVWVCISSWLETGSPWDEWQGRGL